MKPVLIIISVVLILVLIFSAANWDLLVSDTQLSFVAFSIEGPMGVILLGTIFGLGFLVVVYTFLLRTTALVESRRLNRLLEEQRELANKAETSRITALHNLVEAEFKNLRASTGASSDIVASRLDGMEQAVGQKVEDAANSILAHLGYLDDKLKGDS